MIQIAMVIGLICVGCGGSTTSDTATVHNEVVESSQPVITYKTLVYDNQGNNYLTLEGQHFDISPNKVKQFGYSSDGSWDSWYETSSVMTIEIDGRYINSCGSTIIFKDTRLEMFDIPAQLISNNTSAQSDAKLSADNKSMDTYFGLKNWWYDIKEDGQGGRKVVLVQSQDGYNIGAFAGNDVRWEVADKLPKTTMITIDGLPLYIHRCNFTIIDSELIDISK